jgi:hypothetical protein
MVVLSNSIFQWRAIGFVYAAFTSMKKDFERSPYN